MRGVSVTHTPPEPLARHECGKLHYHMGIFNFINVAPPFLDLRINIHNYIYVRGEIFTGIRDIVK
jgi:hypothetical protein